MADLLNALPAPPVTLRDLVSCLGREVRMRENAYPKWVRGGRMDQAEADLELLRMRAALNLVSAIAAPSEALLEAVAMAADAEDASHRGEPTPWRVDADGFGPEQSFRSERRMVVRCALEALFEAAR